MKKLFILSLLMLVFSFSIAQTEKIRLREGLYRVAPGSKTIEISVVGTNSMNTRGWQTGTPVPPADRGNYYNTGSSTLMSDGVTWRANNSDVAGYCCGNRVQSEFIVLSPTSFQNIRWRYWPMNSPSPGPNDSWMPDGETYNLVGATPGQSVQTGKKNTAKQPVDGWPSQIGEDAPKSPNTDDLEDWRSQLADDATQSVSTEVLNELAEKAGASSFGALVKGIPADDLASALGAAYEGDSEAAKSALAKGLFKSLFALSAEFAIGTSIGVAAPVIMGIGAGFLAGQVFEILINDQVADSENRLRELDAKHKLAKDEYLRSKLKFERDVLVIQLELMKADNFILRLKQEELISQYHAQQLSKSEYEQACAVLTAESAKIIMDYNKDKGKLKPLAPIKE